MAVLGRGAGVTVTAQMDADLLIGIIGDAKVVLKVGKQMEAKIIDNNTIRIYDGIIVSQGRDIHISANTYDEFNIENGAQSVTRYDVIGYYIHKSGGVEICDQFVQKDVGKDGEITEDILREGANSTYISLYKAKIEGLSLTELIPLYTKIQTPMTGLQNQITSGTAEPTGGEDCDVYIKLEE